MSIRCFTAMAIAVGEQIRFQRCQYVTTSTVRISNHLVRYFLCRRPYGTGPPSRWPMICFFTTSLSIAPKQSTLPLEEVLFRTTKLSESDATPTLALWVVRMNWRLSLPDRSFVTISSYTDTCRIHGKADPYSA